MSNYLKLVTSFIPVSMVLGFIGLAYADYEVGLNEAIDIGKVELCKNDKTFCNANFEIIDADNENTKWNNSVLANPKILDDENIRQMELEKKKYWAIYYLIKHEPVMVDGVKMRVIGGGAGFVFIEKKTGRLIGMLLTC